ncbi:DMP19 family protein [Duganella qianjiadongensis]|uniref:DUF4375 domain-containing protein n=1 Tax=Duganella qianjiadongensis TaxID=2692176 RepID=A0ABW9VQY1_9BURK|nr:DUF4375 domain-containing protein [Duganella qianjiadongensis]MYM41355.1 DUF4375 domain-containing protein [Duganella qianjiadongensis]
MIYQCRDCGAERRDVPPNQVNLRCLLCEFGLPATREPWLTTVSAAERQVALQHAHALRRELSERGAGSPDSVETLSDIERQFWAVGCLYEAVHDGGFELFFHRYTFNTYLEALRGLDAMGAWIGFRLLGKAHPIITGCVDLPDDAEARRVFLAAKRNPDAQQQLDRLRQAFCSDEEDLAALWYEFGLQHGFFQLSG